MKPIANYTPKQMEEIIGFIEENFGGGEFIAHERESEYVHTDVNISDNGEMKNLVTFGMGAGRMNAPVESFERIELVMNASQDVDIMERLIALKLVTRRLMKTGTICISVRMILPWWIVSTRNPTLMKSAVLFGAKKNKAFSKRIKKPIGRAVG